MWSVVKVRTRGLNFLVGVISNRRGEFRLLVLQVDPPPSPIILPFLWYPNLPITKSLRIVLILFTVMILKKVSESILFQSNKFTACKVKYEKDVANSWMACNLLKIIYPLQGKKHLKTEWNLNCNPQKY